MGSFYGNYGGSGGTTNYNELENKPIINLTGLPNNPIDLSKLQPGEYILKGYYKYNNIDEDIKFNRTLKFSVVEDPISEQKNIFFTTTENNKYTTYLITYDKNNNEYVITNPSSNGGEKEVVFIESLEEEGKQGILYVYNNDIYQWEDGKFVDMTNKDSIGLWGQI